MSDLYKKTFCFYTDFKLILFAIVFLPLFTNVTTSFSQDKMEILSKDLPTVLESSAPMNTAENHYDAILEKKYKNAIESGDRSEANRLKIELEKFTKNDIKTTPVPDNNIVYFKGGNTPMNTDWLTANKLLHNGKVKDSSDYYKQTDLKIGDDGFMYAAVNCHEDSNYNAKVLIYKSTNNGLNWFLLSGIGYPDYYIGNISMTVESRYNPNPDSTRIILYYNLSVVKNLYTSHLFYFSHRVDGNSNKGGLIDYAHGGKLTYLSAVTDGDFYSSATYFGVVYSVMSNDLSTVQSLKFMRTTDWGETWVGATLNTGFQDYYPSAMLKPGFSDSLWIAVERRFSPTQKAIRVIKTTWNPSTSISISFITNASNDIYEKPCLAIQQNEPSDSIMISCTKNNRALYHYTTTGGASWTIDKELDVFSSSPKSYTYCTSSRSGTAPFSIMFMTMNGDSIVALRGHVNLLPFFWDRRVNSENTSLNVIPVCMTLPSKHVNFPVVIFSGSNTNNLYVDQEGLATIKVDAILQGYYNKNTKVMNSKDTLRAYLYTDTPPLVQLDSAIGVFDSVTFSTYFTFPLAASNIYYLKIRHRNCIDTWAQEQLHFTMWGADNYEFISHIGNAVSNCLTKVDTAPLRYAIYSGDVNKDGVIDGSDVFFIENDAANFKEGYVVTDLTGDGIVDASDSMIADNNAALYIEEKKPW